MFSAVVLLALILLSGASVLYLAVKFGFVKKVGDGVIDMKKEIEEQMDEEEEKEEEEKNKNKRKGRDV